MFCRLFHTLSLAREMRSVAIAEVLPSSEQSGAVRSADQFKFLPFSQERKYLILHLSSITQPLTTHIHTQNLEYLRFVDPTF